jgi:hypothetical protein
MAILGDRLKVLNQPRKGSCNVLLRVLKFAEPRSFAQFVNREEIVCLPADRS